MSHICIHQIEKKCVRFFRETRLSLRFQVATHMELVGRVPSGEEGSGGMPPPQKILNVEARNTISSIFPHFPTTDVSYTSCVFACFRDVFNSVNFTFWLFPFQCRFFWELFWFYFTTKVATVHVENSQGKSPAYGP